MNLDFVDKVAARVKVFVKEDWGVPFIVGFMVLLIVAAASLSMGLTVLADAIAMYAYFALVVGVVLQLVCFLKFNKKNGEKNHESSQVVFRNSRLQ